MILLITNVFATVFPVIVYSFIYKFPSVYLKLGLTQKNFAQFGEIWKLITYLLEIPLIISSKLNYQGFVIGIPLIIIGQYLNSTVYKLLGETGVYYGVELGIIKNPKKLTGFPFNIGDPQYKGAMLTALGAWFLFQSTFEVNIIALSWVLSYFYIIMVENTPCGRITCLVKN